MFCPKCGVRNLEDVKFCRACGTDIHLVPQALAGALSTSESKGEVEKAAKSAEPPTLEQGLENVFGALAFFLIIGLGFQYFVGYFFIWIWFVIPAFGHLGKGIGQIARSRQTPPPAPPTQTTVRQDALPGFEPHALPAADTAEIVPPSVTEETTRSLGASAPRTTTHHAH